MKNFKDISYLQMAYALAEKAKGWASPNPYVGAVVIKKDIIAGYGYHEKPGKPHAEVLAFQRAGSLAHNSTAYITLEPCVHWGRTPPCVDTILRAKPRRVIISALDPNPLVFKKGVKKIRESGIEVSLGLLEEKNRHLNETYIKFITRKTPFVVVKVAMSLDGKIATKNFSSQWISSSKTREYIHLLRGEFDAIMIGINTLIQDDPRLTVRHPNWSEKRLTRVIIDSHLRFPLRAKILEALSKGKISIFTLPQSSPKKADALRKKGAEVIPTPSSNSKVDIKNVLKRLGKQQISSVLVEGGAHLVTYMLEEKLVDKIFVTISPKLIGGKNAPSFLQGKGVDLIKDSLRLRTTNVFQIDEDIILEGYF